MLSGTQAEQLEELSSTDFNWLEQKTDISSTLTQRKRKFGQFADNIEVKEKQSSETPSTPEKMKCRVSKTTVTTPGGTHYAMGEKVGKGNYGEVYRCRAESGQEIAVKKRLEFKESAHLEAKIATKLAQTAYGYGSFFCPKKSSDSDCKTLPHYLTTPYFSGKDPEEVLENYFEAVIEKENASSLALFGLLTVFIAVAKSYKDFSEEHKLVHGDAHAKNIKLVLSSNAEKIQAIIVDFDFTQEIGELTSGEAGFHQGSELNGKIPASPLHDVYSIGYFYDEMMKCLIEKGIYASREKNNTSDRGMLNTFSAELDLLEALIEQMMLDEDAESFRKRPSLPTVLATLMTILDSAQLKFEKIKSDDFSVKKILSTQSISSQAELSEAVVATNSLPQEKITSLSPIKTA